MDDSTWTIVIFSIALLTLIIIIGMAIRMGQVIDPVIWKDTIYNMINPEKKRSVEGVPSAKETKTNGKSRRQSKNEGETDTSPVVTSLGNFGK